MQRLPLSYYVYRLLMSLISPILLIWIWQTTKKKPSLRANRLGGLDQPINADIWIHCASVGEVNAVMPLISELISRDKKVVLSCFTPTGLAQAERRLLEIDAGSRVSCFLLPVDWQWTIHRLLKQLHVSELWLVETELWPTLIVNAKQYGIRLKLINGRLSPKTLTAPKWWRNLLAHLVTYYIGTCLLRSEQDKAYYTQLGVMPEQLQVTGNLKLCDTLTTTLKRLYQQPYIVFASTHDPEEQRLAHLWQKHPTLPKLVIVPRHPNRGTQIAKTLASDGILYSQRSQHPEQYKGVIIADTFGELLSWMAHSELVIMGGSFVLKGGQNPIEATRLGKYVITGPDMHDFVDENLALMQVGSLMQVAEINEDMIAQIKMLLKQPELISQKGQAGQAWLLQMQQQVMNKTCLALFPS